MLTPKDVVGWMDCRVETRLDVGDRTLYLVEVVLGGRFVPRGPLAHDEDPHSGMRQQRTDIDVAVAAFERGQVFGEVGHRLEAGGGIHDQDERRRHQRVE